MTRIVFDNSGKPHWIYIPESGAWLHNPDHYARIALEESLTRCQYTQADLGWFRGPIKC